MLKVNYMKYAREYFQGRISMALMKEHEFHSFFFGIVMRRARHFSYQCRPSRIAIHETVDRYAWLP